MRRWWVVPMALVAVVVLGATACRSGSSDATLSSTSSVVGSTTEAPPPTSTSTTIAPPDESVCPQPYQPQAYRFLAPSQTEVFSSGPIAELDAVEIPQFRGMIDEYPGTPPEPPPGVTVPGDFLGVADLGPMGTFSAYVGSTAPQTVYLANQDRVMALASPRNYTIAFRILTTPDGAVYAEVDNNDRSGMSFVRWRLDDPCATPVSGPPHRSF
jgi:hypothetical protein